MVGVLAIGQTLIILTAGIDLSCGMVMALGGDRDDQAGGRRWACRRRSPSLLRHRRDCAVFGLVNGLLVTRIKLPPFIVTLGTLNIAFALTQLYSQRRRRSPTCPPR